MNDLVSALGLGPSLASRQISWENTGFEQLYEMLAREPQHADLVESIEGRVSSYFAAVELPSEVTFYDRLLLSLRPKDLVATFNWDPLLVQAYRRNATCIKALPQIVFLHGNVGIGLCIEHRVKGYLGTLCEQCGAPLGPTPLLYPIADKNYTKNPFISSEWAMLTKALEEAYFLTIFGYSAPKSDASARELMRKAWDSNDRRALAEISIYDIKPEDEVQATWQEFVTDLHYSIHSTFRFSWLMRHPRRSCETLAAATLMNNPWPDRNMPELTELSELHAWVQPLIEEEHGHQREASGFVPPQP